MRKLKILLTIPNFDTAGSGKVLYDLASGLKDRGIDVSILCSSKKGEFYKTVASLGVPIYCMDFTVPYKPYFSIFKRLKPFQKFIKEHQFDVVHSWHWSSDWTEALAVRLAGSNYVFTKKAMSWGNMHWKIRSFLANYIITINHEMFQFFPWKKQQSLIPLGLDTHYYAPQPNRQVGSKRVFRIITVANLVPVKGIEFLIQALHYLNNQNIVLDIIGDTRDIYVRELEILIENLSLTKQVAFKGKHTDVRPFFTHADLYVIPTRNMGRKEGMPMALVEAMSMGVPVIGSNISGINFVLKDFPNLIFEPDNFEAIANKIQEIYQMDAIDRMSLGTSLRNYVTEHFSMDSFISAHEALYSKLISQ